MLVVVRSVSEQVIVAARPLQEDAYVVEICDIVCYVIAARPRERDPNDVV